MLTKRHHLTLFPPVCRLDGDKLDHISHLPFFAFLFL